MYRLLFALTFCLCSFTTEHAIYVSVIELEHIGQESPNNLSVKVFSDDLQNANGDRRLMLFVWTDPKTDPVNVVTSGMTASNSKIVEIPTVGDKAAAGFASGKLKLFTARNRKGMIGIRVREPIMQDDEKFDDVKALVATLLGRLK